MPDAMKDAELDAEFEAMRTIDTALAAIPEAAQSRVLRWACEKRGVAPVGGQRDA